MEPERVRAATRVPHGGEPNPDILDFSANTNHRTPDGTREVYAAAFDEARRYPDDGYPAFRAAAADVVDCDPEQVVPTPGGLAAIRLAIATRVKPGDSVLLPAPSFAEYAREVELQGGRPEFVAHDALLDTDPAEHTMAVVCTPNNPTGEAADPDRLRAFAVRCRATNTDLLVDEAFLGYTRYESLAGTPGVVVARSLTKLYGLPGIRAGYAVATDDRLADLQTARRAWNLSTPAARVGAHCLRDEAFVAETRDEVARERARLREALATRYEVFPSDAPFLLFDTGDESVDDVVAWARENGVAVRDATTFRGLDSHVRVAVKSPDENDQLLEALDVRD
ncbi:threonine-phosphate decarboxylase CobD [Halorarius litoreus]|uniref:threonine-phosphate decarboxylase CobD n=1 Tax=Halorarius litoreus TaxID=2962676 RepID=UPI0020CED9C5|nr:threonine-phosphate decarboxylase CobD [Halorarius litoreus]